MTSTYRSASSISIDPFQPVLSTVTCDKVLEIVGSRDTLRFRGTQEVLHDGVGVVAKGNLDWTLEAVDVTVVARPLVRLMLLHEGNELLRGPAFGLEVIVIASRCTSVHHEVYGAASAENVRAGNDGTATSKPFRRPGVVKGSCLAVELHVSWVDTWAIDPDSVLSMEIRQTLSLAKGRTKDCSSCSLHLRST